jgi:hypothetical protein
LTTLKAKKLLWTAGKITKKFIGTGIFTMSKEIPTARIIFVKTMDKRECK